MKNKSTVLSLLLIFSIMFTGCQTLDNQGKTEKQENISSVSGNSEIKKTDDYYAAVNEKLLKKHGQNENGENWNWFFDLEDKAYKEQKEIIQSAADKIVDRDGIFQKNQSEFKLGMLYSLAIDQKGRDADGISYFDELMKPVMDAKSIQEFMDELAILQYHYNFKTLLDTEVLARDDNPGEYVVQINDMDFGVDKEEFEYEEGQEDLAIYFENYLPQILKAAGWSESDAEEAGKNIFNFVKTIAKSREDGEYKEISVEKLQKIYTNFDLKQYLGIIYHTIPTNLYIRETGSLKKLNECMTGNNLNLLKQYVYAINLDKQVPYLTSDMIQAKQKMEEDYIGDADPIDSEKSAVKQTAELLKWDMGKLYAERNFDSHKKEQAQSLVKELLDEYKIMIHEENWLSQETKEKALKKLDCINIRIGVPKDIDKYLSEYLPVSRMEGGSYFSNVMQIRREITEKKYNNYGQEVNRSVWNILPQELIPCYYPTDNSINIPVIVLDTPYFSVTALEEENLGGIGTIIGHEITHAFDDLGSKYDEKGNYTNWWTERDRQEFEKRAEKIITYYSNYKTSGIMRQDGKQTLGENIADLGSMHCLSRIVEKKGLDAERFFESYANTWASVSDEFSTAIISGMDEHAADKVRVNAVLASCELFYKTYSIKNGDGMFIEPEKRVELW